MVHFLKSGFFPSGVIFYTLFTLATTTLAGTYSGGSGTAQDPYKISSIADWQELIATSADYGKNFILLNDIDFGGINLTPVAPDIDSIAWNGFQGTPFMGIFNGNGHVLRNVVILLPGMAYVGLFGNIGSECLIQDLAVENTNIQGIFNVGGLTGLNNGTIKSCYTTGIVIGGGYCIGGLAGTNSEDGLIDKCYSIAIVVGNSGTGGLVGANEAVLVSCYATGTVDGTTSVGGLVGDNYHGTISSCYATGAVNGDENCVGGLVGSNRDNCTIVACYATGVVKGMRRVGGLAGDLYSGTISSCYATGSVTGSVAVGGLVGVDNGSISYCYATGSVGGSSYSGGLVGGNVDGTITACFWDIESSGKTSSAGGLGKTTAEMKTVATFTDAGWDFVGESANGTVDVWRMCVDGVDYPRLSWEFTNGGDMSCPDGVGFDDLAYLAGRWMAGMPETAGAADVNGDGRVGIEDFAVMAENWNK